MLKKIFIAVLALSIVSCGNSEKMEAIPADILDKAKMTEVMIDLALADAVITLKTIQEPAFNADSLVKFNIFKQHNITRTQYENSITYYSAHPADFKEVYDGVAKKLEDMGTKK